MAAYERARNVAESLDDRIANAWVRRELDVLRLLVDGLTNSEIGARLYISPKTASVHVTSYCAS